MNWIEEEAKKIKANDERKKAAKEWSLHKSKILSAKAPDLWRTLQDRCRNDADVLNKSFEGDDSRQAQFKEVSANQFTVTKNRSPFVLVKVSIQPDSWAIKIKTREIRNPADVPSESERTIEIDVDEHENLKFIGYSEGIEGVSRAIFDHILQACRG
jgi:hypothetical protein